MSKRLTGILCLLLPVLPLLAQPGQPGRSFTLTSPDGHVLVHIVSSPQLQWSLFYDSQPVLAPSGIGVTVMPATTSKTGETPGNRRQPKLISSKETNVDRKFAAHFYKKDSIADQYHELKLSWNNGQGILFRAYNDGAAYRQFFDSKDSVVIQREQTEFNFDKDYRLLLPYVRDPRRAGDQFQSSFENLYTDTVLSGLYRDSIAFLPALVYLQNGMKAVITEADLENYPGMYLRKDPQNDHALKGDFAAWPVKEENGGAYNIDYVVTQRAGYLAKIGGKSSLPWRVVVISKKDKDLANNDMVQKLAAPCRLKDISWIRPGQVAWDWWNDWNISHVDFRAGINTATYNYYIDFAAANRIAYIIIDVGWSDYGDLMKVKPGLDLQEVIDYGRQRNVGVILWSTWNTISRQMEAAFAKYSAMGVKGFKIDFLDRDDAKTTSSTYRIAAKAAEYHLLVDFHGMYKPDGLQRTYPNVVNCEGVRGMENVKWSTYDNVPRYDVTIPFIRMLAGPMDYTPGAMRNSIRGNFTPLNSAPMSQGTRCHQLAMYVVFEAPLQMLADNPTTYSKEQESTTFIAGIPTTFDETVALDGKVGEYIALARRKGDTWYLGAMTNWDARDLSIDLSFLPPGRYTVDAFRDGINADRDATDYSRSMTPVSSGDKINIHMSNGGGWAAVIRPIAER